MSVQTATSAFPLFYRITLLYIEPLIALGGIVQTLFAPQAYLSTMTRSLITFSPPTAFLYTQLAGAWAYFIFVELVVLRLFDDRRLWYWLCVGMLLSDFAFCWSAAQALGGWGVWIKVGEWTVEDWVVFGTTLPQVVVRVLIVLNIGVRDGAKEKKE